MRRSFSRRYAATSRVSIIAEAGDAVVEAEDFGTAWIFARRAARLSALSGQDRFARKEARHAEEKQRRKGQRNGVGHRELCRGQRFAAQCDVEQRILAGYGHE